MSCEYDEKKECNCRIEIEDSIVVIICGEIDVDRLKKSLKSALELKDNK